MLNKIIYFLLIFLFLSITLINSHLLDFFGLSKIGIFFYVNGNYEFTKTIYFNIFSSILITLFFIKNIKNKNLIIPKEIYFIFFILFISNIFSNFSFISFFGNNDKNHSFLIFINLIGIYIILKNSKKKFKKKLINILIFSFLFIDFFALKEYFFPTFDYGNLKNRAFGFFGHPNYLALYLLLFFPILLKKLKNRITFKNFFYLIIFILNLITIFFTKSFLAIFLLFLYFIYFFWKKTHINSLYLRKYKYFLSIIFFVFFLIFFYIFQTFGYSKLHSFLSRFFIWETTLKIIFSDLKIFFIGNGQETLSFVFDNFKSKYLYIFENFGFTADRPHNIFLNIFYHFGFFGLIFFIFLIYKLFKQKKTFYKDSLILALIFLFFNYSSISSYLIIILFLSFYKSKNTKIKFKIFFLFGITIFSIFGSYLSYKLYISEILFYNNKFIEARENYLFGEKLYKFKTCEEKINAGNTSAENYFYCGNFYYPINKKLAIKYYKLGLEKLPDLWNNNSKYYKNILIKNNSDITHRFFSEKYSNIKKILEIVKEPLKN